MVKLDLNLLVTVDVLLDEGSVARAAERLRLSPSAMSRAPARRRQVTGDPLLVRAGRGLVPTPRTINLRERVGQFVHFEAEADGSAEPRDAEAFQRNLAAAINEFMADPDRHAAMGRASREREREQLSWRSIAEQTHRFYRELLDGPETSVG
jgi:DNA-binding transcriptional LysR family regulator